MVVETRARDEREAVAAEKFETDFQQYRKIDTIEDFQGKMDREIKFILGIRGYWNN